jgi:hypothetical protein
MRVISDNDIVSHFTLCIYTQDTSAVRTVNDNGRLAPRPLPVLWHVADDNNGAVIVSELMAAQTDCNELTPAAQNLLPVVSSLCPSAQRFPF